MKYNGRLAKVGLVLAISSVATVALTGASGAPDPQGSTPDLVWRVTSVQQQSSELSQQRLSPDVISPSPQLDPGTIGLCNAGFGDVSIQSWDNELGHIDLFCGDGASGYIHIREGGDGEVGHQAEWQAFGNEASPAINWDDLMATAVGDAVLSDDVPSDQGNDKLCYTSTISLVNTSTGQTIDTIQPTTIVSANNKLIITAYPTHYISDC